MTKLLDLNYYNYNNLSDPGEVLELQKTSLGFVPFIKDRLNIEFIKHMNYEGERWIDGIKYRFFKSRNKFWYIPFATHRYTKKQKPDIVLVQGLVFPLQVIALRLTLGRRTKIIVQHHAEKPYSGIRKIFQRMADKCIAAYMFTAAGNIKTWKEKGVIKNEAKCFEVLEASSYFEKQDKLLSRKKLNIADSTVFLWVGRLISGKDPFTVLEAFKKYVWQNSDAKLYMIYQGGDLLEEVKNRIIESNELRNNVFLQGEVLHQQLPYWFSAADFYISGSHSEGSGYALVEAMACGCIPVVTAIPSFKKMTNDGGCGFLFEPGNSNDLYEKLLKTQLIDKELYSGKIITQFNKELSFLSIADKLYGLCDKLYTK